MVKRIAVILAVVFAVGLLAFGVTKIKVWKVVCESEVGECSEEINKQLEKVLGQTLPTAKRNATKILGTSPFVSDYSVSFKLPPTLFVTVLERQAVWSLATAGHSAVAMIDTGGRVVSYKENTNLPKIVINKPLPMVGDTISEGYLAGLTLFAKTELIADVKNAVITDNFLTLELASGQTVIYSLEKDVDTQLGALVLLLARLNSKSAEFTIDNVKTIDLRFANPVLK